LRRTNRLPLRTWRVQIAAHDVPPRWRIPAQTVRLPADSADDARLFAVRTAHRAAGVPPWRPCVRESMRHATASEGRAAA